LIVKNSSFWGTLSLGTVFHPFGCVRSDMKSLLSLSRRMLRSFRSRWLASILLSGISLVTCLAISGWQQTPLQAQEPQLVATQTAWQYASFPVENFQAYTSPFGYRISPVDGTPQFHRGLDIAAPLGSYVRNWWTGRVVEVSDNTGCGTSIKIQSGEWQHIYCHLMGRVESSPQGRYLIDREGGIVLWQGQDVPVGARIARVGMTGRTTGPHLHWGLMYGGNYLDPALVLQEMFRQQTTARS
jgi:murein DD-endopeptidase MepM/ murein hydrolase activator NlpD